MRKQWKPGTFLLPLSGLGTRLPCSRPFLPSVLHHLQYAAILQVIQTWRPGNEATQSPRHRNSYNEMIRPASAHVAMSAYLLYILRKGGTLGQQRRTEVKHTHNYALHNTLSPMLLSVTGLATQLCLPSDLPVCSTPPGQRHTVVIIEGREEGRDGHKSHVHVHNNKHSQQRRWCRSQTYSLADSSLKYQIIAYFSDSSHLQFWNTYNRYCK